MTKYLLLFTSTLFALVVSANSHGPKALQYVPDGKIVQEKKNEVKVQTPQGNVIELEFDGSGTFEEASGNVVDADVLNPPSGLVTLSVAANAARAAGKNLSGKWKLEKSLTKGWYYEFKGFETGNEMEYTVDASTGKFLAAKFD